MSNHEQAVSSRVHTTSCYREELVLVIVYINLSTLVSLLVHFYHLLLLWNYALVVSSLVHSYLSRCLADS